MQLISDMNVVIIALGELASDVTFLFLEHAASAGDAAQADFQLACNRTLRHMIVQIIHKFPADCEILYLSISEHILEEGFHILLAFHFSEDPDQVVVRWSKVCLFSSLFWHGFSNNSINQSAGEKNPKKVLTSRLTRLTDERSSSVCSCPLSMAYNVSFFISSITEPPVKSIESSK